MVPDVATAPPAPSPAGVSGVELAQRVVISAVACGLVTWQLAETANFRREAEWAASKVRCCSRLGGTPLQWHLVMLMLIAALEGVVGVVADVILLATDPSGAIPLEKVQQELGIQLVLGKISNCILSLMIIGLGVDGWTRSTNNTWAKCATALGCASLVIARLPPPLVLVGGVFIMQRTPKARAGDDASGSGCCSLRCALRPLLMLALLEAVYASVTVDADFVRRLEETKRDAHRVVEHQQHVDAARHAVDPEQAAAIEQTLAVFDALTPETMLEMAAQQLAELVMVGTVIALGISGRSHGLKHTMLPVAAALVPGLPTAFAVVFYFLLETRQTEGGGTLLPLRQE